MKRAQLRFGKGFSVRVTTKRAQAATMTLVPGDREGGPDNRHRGADQWLFVVGSSSSPAPARRGRPTATSCRAASRDPGL